MKKLNPNRYQQAYNEISSIDRVQADRLPNEIDKSEENHYHVAMIRISSRPNQVKNDVNVTISKFHKSAFAKLEKNYQFLGYNKIVVLHDPTRKVEVEKKANTEAEIDKTEKGKSDDEIEAEIERRANEKAKEIIDAGKNVPTESNEPNQTAETKKETVFPDFGDTVEKMQDFASKNEVDLTGIRKKADIESALKAWFEDLADEQKQAF